MKEYAAAPSCLHSLRQGGRVTPTCGVGGRWAQPRRRRSWPGETLPDTERSPQAGSAPRFGERGLGTPSLFTKEPRALRGPQDTCTGRSSGLLSGASPAAGHQAGRPEGHAESCRGPSGQPASRPRCISGEERDPQSLLDFSATPCPSKRALLGHAGRGLATGLGHLHPT